MTIFPLEFTRLPELFAVNLVRWKRRNAGVDLRDLSDRTLEDIGMTASPKRDLDAVKPFWMP